MQDDFDDGGMGMPEDEITGGADLGELEAVTEVEVESAGERRPSGRARGGARGAQFRARGNPQDCRERRPLLERRPLRKSARRAAGRRALARPLLGSLAKKRPLGIRRKRRARGRQSVVRRARVPGKLRNAREGAANGTSKSLSHVYLSAAVRWPRG